MNPKDCCKGIEMELVAWKAKIYHVVRHMDKLPGGEKQKILGNVEDLHMLIAEIDDRIDQVRADCPSITEFKPIKEDLDNKLADVRVNYEDAMAVLGAGNFGG
jgi:hypothetical protein